MEPKSDLDRPTVVEGGPIADEEDAEAIHRVLTAVFLEVALPFVLRSSSEDPFRGSFRSRWAWRPGCVSAAAFRGGTRGPTGTHELTRSVSGVNIHDLFGTCTVGLSRAVSRRNSFV